MILHKSYSSLNTVHNLSIFICHLFYMLAVWSQFFTLFFWVYPFDSWKILNLCRIECHFCKDRLLDGKSQVDECMYVSSIIGIAVAIDTRWYLSLSVGDGCWNWKNCQQDSVSVCFGSHFGLYSINFQHSFGGGGGGNS